MKDLVIGAGVSGIAYANFTKNSCEIIEREHEIGGYCRTTKRNGFVWDYSGHFFHFQDPDIEALVCRHINSEDILHVEKVTSILYNGIYVDFPFQKNIHQLPKEEFIDCLYDLFAAKEDNSGGSFKDMVISNLGKSIAEKFLIPYNTKLYACDLNHLDKDAMGRFFPKASKEDIILNFRNTNNASYNATFDYPMGGAIEYINSLLDNIPEVPVSCNEELVSIDVEQKVAYTNKRSIQYENLISTMPLNKLIVLCDLPVSDCFTSNQVLVFNIGFDKKGRDKKNCWVYVPDKDVVFYRVGYYDNILGSDRMSLYVEIGMPSNAEIDFKSMYERVLTDLRKVGIVNDEQVVDYDCVVMNPAYVHINQSSIKEVERIKSMLAEMSIYSIGRYGSWTYCSIEDNIKEARNLANELTNGK